MLKNNTLLIRTQNSPKRCSLPETSAQCLHELYIVANIDPFWSRTVVVSNVLYEQKSNFNIFVCPASADAKILHHFNKKET